MLLVVGIVICAVLLWTICGAICGGIGDTATELYWQHQLKHENFECITGTCPTPSRKCRNKDHQEWYKNWLRWGRPWVIWLGPICIPLAIMAVVVGLFTGAGALMWKAMDSGARDVGKMGTWVVKEVSNPKENV